MINFTKELSQNTTVVQSEHMEQYSKSSNDRAIWRQSMISAVDNNNGQQWTTMDNNDEQQSAVQHAFMIPFLIYLKWSKSLYTWKNWMRKMSLLNYTSWTSSQRAGSKFSRHDCQRYFGNGISIRQPCPSNINNCISYFPYPNALKQSVMMTLSGQNLCPIERTGWGKI